MRVPVALQHGELLAYIEALDKEFSQPGVKGSFKIALHYGPEGEQTATVECPSRTFTVRKAEKHLASVSQFRKTT